MPNMYMEFLSEIEITISDEISEALLPFLNKFANRVIWYCEWLLKDLEGKSSKEVVMDIMTDIKNTQNKFN